MANQINIFILSFGILQSMLITIFIFTKKMRKENSILGVFLTVVAIQLAFKVMAKSWLWYNVRLVYNLSYTLPYLIGPLFYFYIRSLFTSSIVQQRDYRHFIPFSVYIIQIAILTLTGTLDSFSLRMQNTYLQFVLQLTLLCSYGWVSKELIRSHVKDSNQANILRQFLVVVVITESILILAQTIMQIVPDGFPEAKYLFIGLTFMIYYISYKAAAHPNLILARMTYPSEKLLESKRKYANSGLRPDEADRIATLLLRAMKERKVYLQSDISIDILAQELGVSKHHLSQVINENFNKSFYDFINHWRVEEGKTKLLNPTYKHYTIAAIAYDSGFNSISVFTNLFKKYFGITPSKFRELNS